MKEVAELDAQLRQTVEEREAAMSAQATLQTQQVEQESTSEISERLLRSMEAQCAMVKAERDEQSRQHRADKEFLNGIFTELEAQLTLARSEREELQSRGDRERRAATKRIRELEEHLAAALADKERQREACDREKQMMAKNFEQRVAGLRLDHDQAKLDKTILRRLEAELKELKELSTSVLGPLARPPRGLHEPRANSAAAEMMSASMLN